jgi:NADH dehydrogenase
MPNISLQKILVLGGSGFVGRHVCEALSRQGHRITVPTRRLPARSVQMFPGVEVVRADVHDPAQLASLVRGHDAVVNLVAILHGSEAAFDHVHVQLMRHLVAACNKEGVHRLVHISALGADEHAASMYQRSKARGEKVLRTAVQTANLELTVLRPSVIFGLDDKFINVFAKLQAVFPFMPLAGATTRFQPVWVQDVARAVVHCLSHRTTVGETFELCGPEVFTLQQLVELAGRWSGHPRFVLPLPATVAHLQAFMMEFLPGPTLMSRDNLASMQTDNVASKGAKNLRELGILQPQSLQAVFPSRSR